MRERVLITVKTYPAPSQKYTELVCTAGVRADGSFVRLYPIDFRYRLAQFKKYQWVELDLTKNKADPRIESYRPELETMALGEVLPAGDWKLRREVVLAGGYSSIEVLRAKQAERQTSLGIVRPREVLGMKVEPTKADWSSKQRQALLQGRMFGPQSMPLTKIPFHFRYVFRCEDETCRKPHEMMTEDWELGTLYLRALRQKRSVEAAIADVQEKFFTQMCAPGRDPYFFVGTHSKYPRTWMILGTFWPPRVRANSAQGELL